MADRVQTYSRKPQRYVIGTSPTATEYSAASWRNGRPLWGTDEHCHRLAVNLLLPNDEP